MATRPLVLRRLFHRYGPLGGGREGIAPQFHRGRARVARGPGENQFHPRLSGDGFHRAQRAIQPLQHGPLLDMEFEKADRVVVQRGRGKIAGVEAIIEDRLADRDALRVAAAEQVVVDRGTKRPAPDKRGPEPYALLLREADYFQSERQPPPGQRLDQRDGKHHAQNAVVRAGVRDGVQMRADEKSRQGRPVRGGIHAAQVSRRVDMNFHAQCPHPTADFFLTCPHGRRKEGPCNPRRILAETCHGLAPGDGFPSTLHEFRSRFQLHSAFAADTSLDRTMRLVGGNEDVIGIVLAEAGQIDEKAVLVRHRQSDFRNLRAGR